jgi:hypothetical protein
MGRASAFVQEGVPVEVRETLGMDDMREPCAFSRHRPPAVLGSWLRSRGRREMKAVRSSEYGGLDVLRVADVEEPHAGAN